MLATGSQIGPYEVREPLGRGGMGEVYRARDHRLGRELALKVLPTGTADSTLVERFAREARAASALNHPNVVTVYDVGETDSGRFIAMELVDGVTLRALVGTPMPVGRLAHLGVQVARALAVAHAAGIVHRDVKPENVMLRLDGYVKVLDFGVARLAARATRAAATDHAPRTSTELTRAGLAVGTLRYMSPEQACGEEVTGAADVFALGVVLHELATGRHPFASASDVALMGALLTATPSAPSAANPELPSAFDALLARMLEKDPVRRPPAADVERALAELAGPTPRPAATGGARDVAAPERHTVGRDGERRALREAIAAAEAGHGLVLSVAGEPGIGKTTLVEEFLAELTGAAGTSRPCWVARGRCSERLAGTEAYLPVLEALDGLTRGPGAAPAIALMKRLAPTWYLQVAPAAGDDSAEHRALASAQAGSQERLKRELSAFLEELSRLAPVVLFLDDLHWADASTVDALAYLGTRLAAVRLLVVVTVRPSDLLVGRHPFSRLKPELQARGLCRELALEFLTPDEVEKYLSLQFPGHAFPASFPALIHAKTDGSPLFMADLLRYLRTRGVVAEAGGRWTLVQAVPAIEQELPESIRGMIQRKIEQLGEDDRRLLTAASVQGVQFDSALVAELTATDPAEVEERLETLEHVYGFVRRAQEHELPDGTLDVRYRFVHALYQNALYGGLAPTRRVSLSARAAQALLGHYGGRATEIAADLALLFEAARDPERASAHFLVAAQGAARLFAHQEVMVLCRRGLALLEGLPKTPERARRAMLLAFSLAVAHMITEGYTSPEARRAFAAAQEYGRCLEEDATVFPTLAGLWGYHAVAGHYTEAAALTERLLRIAEREQAALLWAFAHFTRGLVSHALGDQVAAQVDFERAVVLYEPAQHRTHLDHNLASPGVFALGETVRTLWLLGYPDQALARAERAVEAARALEDPRSLAMALVFATFVRQFRREPAEARAWAERTEALCDEYGIAAERAWVVPVRGWAIAALGQVDEGLEILRGGIAALRSSGAELTLPYFYLLLADALAAADRTTEALAACDEGLAVARRTGEVCDSPGLQRLRGECLLRGGVSAAHTTVAGTAAEEAERCLREALSLARRQHVKGYELRAAMRLAQMRWDQGHRDEARRILGDVLAWFTEGFETVELRDAQRLSNSFASAS